MSAESAATVPSTLHTLSVPSKFSVAASSVPASASALMAMKLAKNNMLVEQLKKTVEIGKLKETALAEQLAAVRAASKTSKRKAAESPMEPKTKRASPGSSNSPLDLSQSPASKFNEPTSDDEVPVPTHLTPPTIEPSCTLFRNLQSVLCAYKEKKIEPGAGNLSYDICAHLCKKEAEAVAKWPGPVKTQRLSWVISALKVTYPHKKKEWFLQPFLNSPKHAATYWVQVLQARAAIWEQKVKESKKSRFTVHGP